MKQLLLVVMLLLVASQVWAGECLDIYGNGAVKATLAGFEPLGHGYSVNGFCDIKEDGWFSKVRLAKMQDWRGLAIELRAASGGFTELAIGPQVEFKNHYGFVRATYWFDEKEKQVLSLWQQHNIDKDTWTNGWVDIKDHGQMLGELQVGRKISSRTDLVAEYRFGSLRASKELAIGMQFVLR